LIPIHLSINSLNDKNNMAGSRATEACEPRQVRKEAAAAMFAMCCGKPGHQFTYLLVSANVVGSACPGAGRGRFPQRITNALAEPPPGRLVIHHNQAGIK